MESKDMTDNQTAEPAADVQGLPGVNVKPVQRVLVCGGRDFSDRAFVFRTLDELCGSDPLPRPGIVIITGGAEGADRIANDWSIINWTGFEEYPADWGKHGKAAGPIRNQKMLDEGRPQLVVAFAGGRGTADMVKRARAQGFPVIEPRAALGSTQ